MTIIYPEATPTLGNTTVVVALTLSSESAPSLATDFTTTNSLNVSCFMYGALAATAETTKGSAPKRVCDVSVREQFGPTNFTIADLQYTYDPQAADTTDENKAKAMLEPNLEVWLAERLGLPSKTTALAVAHKVNLHHVRLGPQNRTVTGDDDFAEYSITQGAVLLEDSIYDVAIAA